MKDKLILLLVTLVLISGLTSSTDAASFQGLGGLPGGTRTSVAADVSADGSVVVGSSRSEYGNEGFRWENGTMIGLGDLPGGDRFYSAASGVSADGSVIVGESESPLGDEPFRWENGIMVGLGYLHEDDFRSGTKDVSADGSVIVGYCEGEVKEAFRWENGTMVGLGYLPGGELRSGAESVSADGSVIVGYSESGLGTQAFRWENGTMIGLGDLPGDRFVSWALGVSADGSVIVGMSVSEFGTTEPFRWENGTMIGLGDLPGGTFKGRALCCSADGSVVVGYSYDDEGEKAFIWDADNGMRNLKNVLVNDFGLDLTGWTLKHATGISADGLTIVGYGANPRGYNEGWIATIYEPPNAAPFADADGPYLVAVDKTITLDGSGSYDPDGDPLFEEWVHSNGYGVVTGDEFTGLNPGVGTLTLTVTDTGGLNDSDTAIVVVYDQYGGFVTGGGWIYSEPSSYIPDPTLEGKATFGFVSKYKKGAQVPTGNTEFVFHAADLNFHSSSYDWLVVTGSNYARFKGTGIINGYGGQYGDYKFMVWAGDDNPDTFRIKIWEEDEFDNEYVVYDNSMNQPIGGGSIVIHTK